MAFFQKHRDGTDLMATRAGAEKPSMVVAFSPLGFPMDDATVRVTDISGAVKGVNTRLDIYGGDATFSRIILVDDPKQVAGLMKSTGLSGAFYTGLKRSKRAAVVSTIKSLITLKRA